MNLLRRMEASTPLSAYLVGGAGILLFSEKSQDKRISCQTRQLSPPGKVAAMIWIVKYFQTLLMSALIAVIATMV